MRAIGNVSHSVYCKAIILQREAEAVDLKKLTYSGEEHIRIWRCVKSCIVLLIVTIREDRAHRQFV